MYNYYKTHFHTYTSLDFCDFVDNTINNMDNNKILKPADFDPRVRVANYHSLHRKWSLQDRQNADSQFIFLVSGALQFRYGRNSWRDMSPGDCLFIEPGKAHSMRAVAGHDQCWISGFHLEFSNKGTLAGGNYQLSESPHTICSFSDDFNSMHTLFKELANCFESYRRQRKRQLNDLARYILLRMSESWRPQASQVYHARIRKMLNYISKHLAEPINRQALSREFGLSPEHVNYIFKEALGCSPTHYINRERCIWANRLLGDGMSVKEAAYAVGFQDPGYFSRLFRRYMSYPPSRAKSS